ncbi:short-chain dehydrogenase protein [Rutstroemia sp. NJR-2017a BVV2]|nr:short-chain dehydrogenase protein [Rutstroemia sp. NJR-2017a BVV2]
MSLTGKVAIVTGGSKGIGRATCIKLAHEGAQVIVNYSSSSSAADEVVSTIGSEHATAIKADAGNIAEIEKLVDATVKKYGKIDIVVACAAVMHLNELDKVTEADYDQMMSLNVKGPLFLAQVGLCSGGLFCLIFGYSS